MEESEKKEKMSRKEFDQLNRNLNPNTLKSKNVPLETKKGRAIHSIAKSLGNDILSIQSKLEMISRLSKDIPERETYEINEKTIENLKEIQEWVLLVKKEYKKEILVE